MVPLVICAVSIIHEASPATYYVKPNDGPYFNKNAHSLDHYITNFNEYFISHTKLQFLPGSYSLENDLIFQDIKNFTICGNDSVIQCSGLSVAIGAKNVINLTICNIEFANCGRRAPKDDHTISPYYHSGVLYLNHCTTVQISDVIITANPDVSGIVAVNVFFKDASSFVDVKIETRCVYPNNSSPVNGFEFYYNELNNGTHDTKNYNITIRHYIYENNGLCYSSYALFLVLIQESYGIFMEVLDTNFTHLYNASVLYYHGESCGQQIDNNITFSHCRVNNNIGNTFLNMFYALIHSDGYIYSRIRHQRKWDTQSNVITFNDCYFVNNSNMNSLLHFDLKNTWLFNVYIDIKYSNFLYNDNVQILMVNSEVKVITQSSHYISIMETNISANSHKSLVSMISSTNGRIKVSNLVISRNRYENIIILYLSVLMYENYVECSSNFARFIIRAKEVSYYLLKEHSVINITNNLVYASITTAAVYNQHIRQLCYYQFISDRGNLDQEFAKNNTLNYRLLLINNTYTAPQYEVDFLSCNKCSWLPETAFYSSKSCDVFNKVVETNILWANRTIRESALSMVCPCSTTDKYDCKEHHLGSLFPGQTLQVKLIMMQKHETSNVMVAETNNVSKLGCKIIDVLEIVQIRESHGCNEYNYTIWSDQLECELYLGPGEYPEVFYVTLNSCPPGFTRQKRQKSCYCDPVLKSFTSSCNLQDQTVLRPPKSWISGRSSNRTHMYLLSYNCPFDYCSPYSSYVNPTSPDQQCQFKRSGVLCGHCQPDLSVVFGSSHCKQCSSVWLLVVIPIALIGVILVVALFWLNLTVANGTINTFIFYVNIVSINFSVFFPKCHSVCVLLALSNLDLGVDTCFYNGMDAFSKTCLQLAFPFYLILIAFTLIIGSRYSTKIQRLTSQRALPVLATLFLLIYTKILITVCTVLFFFSPITNLPSGSITFVWSVDTKVPLFGIKFSILFTICLVLFLILLPFNTLLLFPRLLSRFHLINTFKPLLDTYLGPYKDNFSCWMGVQLLMRAVFLGLSALDRDVTLTIGTVILGVMLCIQGFVHPYKSKFKNIQESLILLNLQAVYVAALHYDGSSKVEPILLQCLIFTTLAYFIVYIVCHCVMSACDLRTKLDVILKHLKRRLTNGDSTEMLNVMASEGKRGADMVCGDYENFQESLIALND